MEGASADGQLAFAKAVVHCAKDKAITPLKTKLSHAEMTSFVIAMERKSHSLGSSGSGGISSIIAIFTSGRIASIKCSACFAEIAPRAIFLPS
jgi:hypothetical protein